MAGNTWDYRFFETTRGQIVDLLRRGSRTVDELARPLGLTDNAVRAHLAVLERDGLIRQNSVRRSGGVGKPAAVYELNPEIEPLFSKAYLPLLTKLLETLGDRMTAAELDATMRDVGRRLAAASPAPGGDVGTRVRTASRLLNDLGGLTAVEERDGTYVIRSLGCPLAVAVARRPEVCRAVETLLVEATGAEVREHCQRGARPQCCFEFTPPR